MTAVLISGFDGLYGACVCHVERSRDISRYFRNCQRLYSFVSRLSRHYPRGTTVHVARPTRSIPPLRSERQINRRLAQAPLQLHRLIIPKQSFTTTTIDRIGQAVIRPSRVKAENSARYCRLSSTPKKSLLNLWNA